MVRLTKYFLILLAIQLTGCGEKKDLEDREFSGKLKLEVEGFLQGRDSLISVRKIYPQQWDSFYIFQPYTPVSQINKELKFEWAEAESTQISHLDSFCLIVFVQSKQVVKFAKVLRNYGDFMRLPFSGPFTRDQSNFIAREEFYGGANRIFLYPKNNIR